MKSLLAKLWSIWTGSTEVRHAGTAFLATLVVVSVPTLEDWIRSSDESWKVLAAVVLAGLSALARWAQIKLESLKKPNAPQDPAA